MHPLRTLMTRSKKLSTGSRMHSRVRGANPDYNGLDIQVSCR